MEFLDKVFGSSVYISTQHSCILTLNSLSAALVHILSVGPRLGVMVYT